MTENEFVIVESWLREAMEFGEDEHNEPYEKAIQDLTEIQAYRAIGTVEECQQRKEYFDIINEVLKNYSDIGTIEEFKALKEKATPKKGIPYTSSNNHKFVECPSCHKDMDLYYDFCQHCGQSVDWGKSKT